MTVAFGANTRVASASGLNRPASARSSLNAQNLNKFDRKTNSIGVRRPQDPEVQVFTGEEAKIAA